METLDARRESLCLEFGRKHLKNNIFQKLRKYIQCRYEEEYEIDSANTERLKNSPIIYMQRLLNNKV